MAEAESEAQRLRRHLEERRSQPDLGGALSQPAPRLSQARSTARTLAPADRPITAPQPVSPPPTLSAPQLIDVTTTISAMTICLIAFNRRSPPLSDCS